eukprot:1152156-Pelagomonas_calceolata.AAC.3
MGNVSRFRLRVHCLKVESCKWLGGSNLCDECECAEVQDEKQLSFIAIALRCVETVSPAADQPKSWAVGQPLVTALD